MSKTALIRMLPLALVVILLWAQALAVAQTPTVSGQATAMRGTVVGLLGSTTTVLASTGNLVDDLDARAASALTGTIPLVGGAEVLHAATVSSIFGWAPEDSVSSEASLARLVLTVAGNTISAGFAMAEAVAVVGGTTAGQSRLEGLAVNGLPIAPDGSENQGISIPGLTLVLNEVQRSAGVITVNALHVATLDGLVDIVVASASAGIRQ